MIGDVETAATTAISAPATRPGILPDLEERDTSRGNGEGWIVVVYNNDHNTYLEGVLPAKTKELMGLVASACLRCDDCIFYHAIQGYRLGVTRAEQEESLNVALVVGGSIVIPHLRRAYELLEEIYG